MSLIILSWVEHYAYLHIKHPCIIYFIRFILLCSIEMTRLFAVSSQQLEEDHCIVPFLRETISDPSRVKSMVFLLHYLISPPYPKIAPPLTMLTVTSEDPVSSTRIDKYNPQPLPFDKPKQANKQKAIYLDHIITS